MRSVRLRLLFLALAPLVLVLPLLLFLVMPRWTADYDALLISKVESDLKIAQQYLARIMTGTGEELKGVAESTAFADILERDTAEQTAFFAEKQAELGLDFLMFLRAGSDAAQAARWPVVRAGLDGVPTTKIDIFSGADLEALGPELAARARIPLIETEAAVPTDRTVEDRGMVVHSASPVRVDGHEGALVGGILLNRT